ncbi:MAG TPA: spondin domain-containing protein [Gammaproteobacteria bacterium]|nr:spondin domain-containing protein [Gammaproteobacteria bacterium]
MKANFKTQLSIMAGLATALLGSAALAADSGHGNTYDVTITNLTRGVSFTPILAASHRPADHLLFNAGEAASEALAALAEGGDTMPLNDALDANPIVSSTATSAGLLEPGMSVTIQITARSARDRVSLASMLIPTNDAFFSFQNLTLPKGLSSSVSYGPAYDAGSEPNDELCISIPGPVCGGAGGSPGVGGEGFVHVHSGIHGIGNLEPALYDWRNPVARVVIQKTR